MKTFFNKMISSNTEVSSKRVITTVAAVLIFVVVIINLITGKTVNDYIFQGLIWMAMAGLGSIAIESFSGERNDRGGYGGGYGGYGGYGGGYRRPGIDSNVPKDTAQEKENLDKIEL